ncbi:hypothetical protein C5S53_08445 [Methanophagales archaeon]|nr:hypothetical protein C5S53_08445 [Methanophagales archaeon]
MKISVGLVISWILKALMVLLILMAVVRGMGSMVFGGIIALILCMIPTLVNWKWKDTVPMAIEILVTLALLIHIGGEVTAAYFIMPHYDTVAHFTSSLLIACIAFVAIYALDRYWGGLSMDIYVMAFFVVIMSLAIGVIWEFMEWGTDLYTGSWAQRGNQDTMSDLLVDALGGIVMAIIGVLLVKRGKMDKATEGIGKLIEPTGQKKKV